MNNETTNTSEMINENEASSTLVESAESDNHAPSSEESAPLEKTASTLPQDPDRSLGELDSLRAEVERLKSLLAQTQAQQAEAVKEMEEFSRLFPSVSIREIPQSVLDQRDQGKLPLYAAYAIYERERQLERARADTVNQRNAERSAGRAGIDTASEYFSADEVRKMTPKQVHENFSKIRASMQSWTNR